MKPIQLFLLACAMLHLCGTAHAHRFHAGLSELAYNHRTGHIEIVHSFTAHDMEAVLTEIEHRQIDLDQKDAGILIRRYIEKQFTITEPDKKRVVIDWVGISFDADKIIILQEIKNQSSLKNYTLRNRILMDHIHAQLNNVNFILKNKRYSQLFTQDTTKVKIPI